MPMLANLYVASPNLNLKLEFYSLIIGSGDDVAAVFDDMKFEFWGTAVVTVRSLCLAE